MMKRAFAASEILTSHATILLLKYLMEFMEAAALE